MQNYLQFLTIAILGADTTVGHALSALLEGSGYETRPLDAYPTGVVDERLDGSDLLLLAPRLNLGAREAFLSAKGKSSVQHGDLPVISLSTTATNEELREERVLSVPWPCTMEELVDRIEASLCQRHLPLNSK